jgi:hypothetical protein
VHLPAGAMPTNTKGQQISTAEYDRNDGFSPGSSLIVHVPGLDNPVAFAKTGAVSLVNMHALIWMLRGPQIWMLRGPQIFQMLRGPQISHVDRGPGELGMQ